MTPTSIRSPSTIDVNTLRARLHSDAPRILDVPAAPGAENALGQIGLPDSASSTAA